MALVIAKLLRSEISEGYKAHMVIIVRGFKPVAACCPTTLLRYILRTFSVAACWPKIRLLKWIRPISPWIPANLRFVYSGDSV